MSHLGFKLEPQRQLTAVPQTSYPMNMTNVQLLAGIADSASRNVLQSIIEQRSLVLAIICTGALTAMVSDHSTRGVISFTTVT